MTELLRRQAPWKLATTLFGPGHCLSSVKQRERDEVIGVVSDEAAPQRARQSEQDAHRQTEGEDVCREQPAE
jgi:hypothetical protein